MWSPDYFDRRFTGSFSPSPSPRPKISMCLGELFLFSMKSKEEQQEMILGGLSRHLGGNAQKENLGRFSVLEMVSNQTLPALICSSSLGIVIKERQW